MPLARKEPGRNDSVLEKRLYYTSENQKHSTVNKKKGQVIIHVLNS